MNQKHLKKFLSMDCPPPPPGWVFVGMFIDEEDNCWCLYRKGQATLILSCA